MNRALLKRVLSAMDRGYTGRNHAEYVATMQVVRDELDKPDEEADGLTIAYLSGYDKGKRDAAKGVESDWSAA